MARGTLVGRSCGCAVTGLAPLEDYHMSVTSSVSEPLRPSESELAGRVWHCPSAAHCAQLAGLKGSAPYRPLSVFGPVTPPSSRPLDMDFTGAHTSCPLERRALYTVGAGPYLLGGRVRGAGRVVVLTLSQPEWASLLG